MTVVKRVHKYIDFFITRLALHNDTLHCTCFTDNSCKCSCIDTLNTYNTLLTKKIIKVHFISEVRRKITLFSYYKSFKISVLCLHILKINSVVTDKRESHSDNLTCKRRVSKSFLIACHTGCENDFSDDVFLSAEKRSRKTHTVFQNKLCFHNCSPSMLVN